MFKVPIFRQTVTQNRQNGRLGEQITDGYAFVNDQYYIPDKNLIMKNMSVIIVTVIPTK